MMSFMKMSEALIREFALQHKLDARQISVLKTGTPHSCTATIRYPLKKLENTVSQEDFKGETDTVTITIEADGYLDARNQLRNIGMCLFYETYNLSLDPIVNIK